MNKKIVGFVLATCLTLGLGAANVFANSYSGYGMAGQVYTGNGEEYTDHDISKPNEGTDNVNKYDNSNDSANKYISRISAMYNYSSGFLISIRDTTTNNLTVYSGGVAKATLMFDKNTNTYSMGSFNLSGSDYGLINKQAGSTFKDKLKNFLLSMGFTETQLSNSEGTDGRNGHGVSSKDVGWFQQLADHLEKGINFSASIDATAEGGASVTLLENGKTMSVINNAGVTVQSYIYNDQGFLESIIQASPKTEPGKTDENGKTNYEIKGYEYTRVYMDAYGRQSYSVKLDSSTGGTDAKGNLNVENMKPLQKDGKDFIYNKWTYSANGSLLSVYNCDNNYTTYYKDGRQAYTINDKGTKVHEWFYYNNGGLNYEKDYNYTNAAGEKTTLVTAYELGKKVGSFVPGEKNYTANQFRDVVNNLKTNGTISNQDVFNTIQGGIEIYGSDLQNDAFVKFLKDCGFTQQSIDNMKAMDNGYSPVGSLVPTQNITQGSGSADKTINLYFPAGAKGKFLKQKYLLKQVLEEGGEVTVTTPDGKKKKLKKGDKVTVNGEELTAEQYINYLGTAKDGLGSKNDKDADESNNKGLKVLMAAEIDGVSKERQNEILSEVSGYNDNESYEHGADATSVTETTWNLTICNRGAAAYTIKGNTTKNSSVKLNIDPAVKGKFEGTVKIDGKTYAKVKADEVNIMDGKGFKSADGETILVEIDEETEKSLANMKKGDDIMFMGDVTKDVNGYMTMKMNKNYSGGFATGSQINKLREDIQNEKLDWVKQNTATNTAIFGNNGLSVDWKAGWNVLTGKNKAEDLKKKFREDGGVYLAF